jgi:uncharacterized membrane protein
MAQINPIKSLLLGKWLGHPLHPAIVHIPIALWIGALLFDIFALSNIAPAAMVKAAWWAIAIGLGSTLIVVPAGLAEWSEIGREKPAWKLALWHMILNLVTAFLLLISLILRSGEQYLLDQPPMVAFILNCIANVTLLISGYIGGRMVFNHGIAVARMSKKKWRTLAANSNANLPPES